MFKKIGIILEMIKFEHTIFALPYAVMSAFLASNGWPNLLKILWILVAMVGARSCAMAFNRIADMKYDKINPRTSNRALPAGLIKMSAVWIFTITSALIFIFAAYMLNRLAFVLSPLALLVILVYSYSKRFTTLTHLWLGLSLAIAPVGAWIAIKGEFAFVPLLLGLAVMLWTAGFDIIYACQDKEFDEKFGIYSIPKRFGIKRALQISSAMHLITVLVLLSLPLLSELRYIYLSGVGLVSILLVYEHAIVKPNDLSRVNLAFFTLNGMVSLGLMVMSVADIIFATYTN
ncbi:TPA: 4-hydroxybenzoate octaprenyltransferase [Candidatus Poribacteria bacterium]|nr:4-hydroxybenzoate octaprenyltransferase [Candidatus Poribacteria bacterium]